MKQLPSTIALLTCVGLCTHVEPVQAQTPEFEAVKQVATTAYEIYKELSNDELSLEEAVDQIVDAVNASERRIVQHIDDVAQIGALACLRTTVMEHFMFYQMDEDPAQTAREMFACMSEIVLTMSAIEDRASIDRLGFGLHLLGPITMVVYEYAGRSNQHVIDTILETEALLDELLVTGYHWECSGLEHPAGTRYCTEWYTAYNGDVGGSPEDANRNTSAAIESGL